MPQAALGFRALRGTKMEKQIMSELTHEQLWKVCQRKPDDYEPYGKRKRLKGTVISGDCAGGSKANDQSNDGSRSFEPGSGTPVVSRGGSNLACWAKPPYDAIREIAACHLAVNNGWL